MTSVTLALFPVVREPSVVRRAGRQLVEVQHPAAKGPNARRAVPEEGALWAGLCAVGVNTILTLEGFLSPAPWAASSQPFPAGTTSFRVLRWEQKGLGGCRAGGSLFRFPSSQPLPQRAQRFGPGS